MTEVAEKEQLIVIRKGVPFTFFENAVFVDGQSANVGIVEGIGKLTGKATQRDATSGKWAIIFTLEAPLPAQDVRVDQSLGVVDESTTLNVEGEPGETLVMYATLPDETIYGSHCTIEEKGDKRSLVFNEWHKKNDTKSKDAVITE